MRAFWHARLPTDGVMALKSNDEIKQKKIIKAISRISLSVDRFVLLISFILLFIAAYAMFDTAEVYKLASTEEFAQYKPKASDELSYDDLIKLNPEIIGWIEVYGTKIDYPLVQAKDNDKYLHTTVDGRFSTAGSIFLDSRNKKDFSDFNNVIYGHHMAERKMFGDIDKFLDKSFFDSHKYANIKRIGKSDLGVEFFSMVETHGADEKVFNTNIRDNNTKKDLIDYLYKNAVCSRDIGLSNNDRIVLLDTCTFTVTNGRFILAGRLTDKTFKNPFPDEEKENKFIKFTKRIPVKPVLFFVLLLLLIIAIIYRLYVAYKENKENFTEEVNENENNESKK